MKRSVLELLEKSVSDFPDRICYSDIEKSYTFEEVSRIARSIGTVIGEHTVHGQPVAVLMSKSISMMTAFLGAVYGGCCYCPIDVTMPKDRIEVILSVLEPAAVITEKGHEELVEALGITSDIYYFEEVSVVGEKPEVLERVRRRAVDTDPLYVLFTSGSTGVPKGVVVPHRVILNNMDWLEDEYHISHEDVFANQAPLYFDVSDHDVYCPLKFGCSSVIVPPEYFMFPAKLLPFLNERHVSGIFWVPFALSVVANLDGFSVEEPQYLKYVFFAGEVMPVKQLNYWRRALPDAVFANMYGPTETYVCTYYNLNREFEVTDSLPIGFPCGNIDIMVLDEKDNLILPGDAGEGELCVRGCTLASGYYNNIERTRERFVQNPLNTKYPDLIYRTGDIVSYNEYGELLYHDRKDFQIKRLGYRIELGEIEAAAGTIEGIKECACIYNIGRQTILFLYTGEKMEKKAISAHMATKIPHYMMPNKYIWLEEMPRNANGKVDRKKLQKEYC